MKIILYSSNNFQNLLCLEAISQWLKSGERLPHQKAFNGLVSLQRNHRSITAVYLNGKDNTMDFAKPVEEDKDQLRIEYK